MMTLSRVIRGGVCQLAHTHIIFYGFCMILVLVIRTPNMVLDPQTFGQVHNILLPLQRWLVSQLMGNARNGPIDSWCGALHMGKAESSWVVDA